MLKRTCTVALFMVLAGCSDPKRANDKNFKNAIQAYLDTVYPKCYFYAKFPLQIDTDFLDRRAALQGLAKAGLLTEKELSRKEFKNWSGSSTLLIKSEYALTDTGRKYYNADAGQPINRDTGGFCVGKATVREITLFTEPADMFGHRVTQVNYTYRVDKLPDWAALPEVTSAIPALKEAVNSAATPINATNTLILTNNGWAHERLFAK